MWMVFSELVPDALEETRSNIVAAVITLAVAAMVAFQFLIRWHNSALDDPKPASSWLTICPRLKR